MAKPRQKPNGTWTLVVNHAGQRKNLTLGKLPKSQIDLFCRNVELIAEHVKFGGKVLPASLQAWISDLSERHKIQLGELGFFDYRKAGMTVGELFKKYVDEFENRSDISSSTKKKVRSTIRNRVHKLKKIRLDVLEPTLRSVNMNADPIWSEEALQLFTSFNMWQRNHCAPATWTRDNKLLSSIGIWAVKRGFCSHNPFSPLPTASMVNDERNQYLIAEMVLDAMDSCFSPDVRLTLALGRFAGLRTCSEVRTMKWSHVDESAGKLTIIDSKKKKPRVMPLFENVAGELERQRAITGNTRWVASEEMRSTSSAANYQLVRDAIVRSGQTPWERVRQNLRTSCENDLLDLFDERLVTQWLGHTITVSRDHYQKLRPGDYHKAIELLATNNPDYQIVKDQ